MVTDHAMSQAINLLGQQSLLFSLGVALVALLRWAALRWLGAGAAYLSWLLLPMLMGSPWLPAFRAESLPVQAVATHAVAAMAALPSAPLVGPQNSAAVPALLALWAAGALLLALAMLRQQVHHARGVRREGKIWRSPIGSSPAMVGLWPARLTLPCDFEARFNADERRLILAHEGVHARRQDNAWNLLAAVLLALQWFNPLAWWARGRMRADQELACDAAVLMGAAAGDVSRYAQALLKSHAPAMAPALACGWTLRHPLLERVRLLGLHRQGRWQRRGGQALVLLGSASLAILVHAAGAPLAQQSAEPALQLELSYQQGREAWKHSKMRVDMAPWTRGNYSKTVFNMLMGDWCLGVMLYHFPDNTVRPMAQLLKADCSTPLTELAELSTQGQLSNWAAGIDQGALQVQLALHYSAEAAALIAPQAELSGKPLRMVMSEAEMRMREELGQLKAQDRAWRAARGEARPDRP